MKRIVLVALLLIVSLSGMGQNIGDAFYIYRNDGQFNAFFRDEVDSIAYSYYDSDSVYYDEIVTQLVYTADSLYRIPLAAIDSVGFVQPETVYQPGVKVIEGDLRNYVVSSDGLTICFRPDTPKILLPCVGDKLVTTEMSSTFVAGFAGKVEQIENKGESIVITCSPVALDEVFEQFVYVNDGRGYETNIEEKYSIRKAPRTWEDSYSPGEISFPLTAPFSVQFKPDPKGDLAYEFSPEANIGITPTYSWKTVLAVLPISGPTISIDLVQDYATALNYQFSGAIDWTHDFTPGDIPLFAVAPFVWVYGELGIFVRANASISTEQHWRQSFRYTFHYEASRNTLYIPRISFDEISVDNKHSGNFLVKGELGVGVYIELGVECLAKWFISAGGRAEVGVKAGGDIMLYKKDMESALHSTDVYKTLQGNDVHLSYFWKVGLQSQILNWGFSHDFKALTDEKKFARFSIVPDFSDVKLIRDKEDPTLLQASAKVSGNYLPQDLGFTLFEQEILEDGIPSFGGSLVAPKEIYASYFDMSKDKRYEVYPTVKLFGWDALTFLAEPSAKESDDLCPVELSDFEVTYKRYRKGGFHHEGVDYDFCFGVSVTATLDDDVEGIEDWGYIYREPNGREAKISLSKFGKQFIDDRWDYYRNEAHSTCTLYGYVKYEGSDELVYGEPHDYPLEYDVVEAYGVLSEDGTLLTYYYDDKIYEKKGQIMFFGCTDGIITVSFDVSFANCLPESTAGWFTGESLTSIEHIEYLNTSNVTDMSRMFSGCSSLTSLDLSRFNTSNVTDMSGMFSGCSSLTSLDLSRFNTSNVTDMGWMFLGCESLSNLDLSRFNTSNVTVMSGMFSGCSSLTSLDLSSFNTSNVTGMESMFYGCSSLTSLDLSSFSTSNVTDMFNMFRDCSSLKNIDLSNSIIGRSYGFSDCPALESVNARNLVIKGTGGSDLFAGCSSVKTINLSNANTSEATDMSGMFSGCSSLTSLDLSSFSTSNVTDMSGMFSGCSSLTSLNLSSFNTSNVTSMGSMFDGCSSLTSLDLSSFNTSNVTSMRSMFNGCSSLTSLDVSNFNIKGTVGRALFSGCSSVKTINFSNANTSEATNMAAMFYDCSSLTSLDLSSFNTSNVTSMESMFDGCSSLTSLNLSSFNTSNVTGMGMRSMFAGCSSLTSLNLSSFNTSNVTEMAAMFVGCSSLTSLNLSSFNTSNVTDMGWMFYGCSSIKTIYAGNWSRNNQVYDYEIFGSCDKLTGGRGTKIGQNHYGYDKNGKPLYYYCYGGFEAAHIDGGKDNPGLFTGN